MNKPQVPEQAVKLVTGPLTLPSDWPMQVGIGLVSLAAASIAGWWVWSRIDGQRAAGWLMRARFCRTPGQWRAAKRVAEAAGAPVAAVFISRTAFERGARAIVESKQPVISPVVVAALGQRVFGGV